MVIASDNDYSPSRGRTTWSRGQRWRKRLLSSRLREEEVSPYISKSGRKSVVYTSRCKLAVNPRPLEDQSGTHMSSADGAS